MQEVEGAREVREKEAKGDADIQLMTRRRKGAGNEKMKKEESEKMENEEIQKKQTEGQEKVTNNEGEQKKFRKTSVWSMGKKKNEG